MDSVFIMHRTGHFRPKSSTSNQCKAPGHTLYEYSLKMVFEGNIKLDERKFIIDHQDVDDLIQKVTLTGSCEQMHQTISRRLQTMMKIRKIDMVACKCLIVPAGAKTVAQLEFITTKDTKYLGYLR